MSDIDSAESLAKKFLDHYEVMRTDSYDNESDLITALFEVMLENDDITPGKDAEVPIAVQLGTEEK